ncbi:tetratricopeptide repeat protein [Mesorhizobium australicum]|uniref:tetratricopeptide repeat protein n=1 Tax=Mesorhizobium australicum TaxID=536018 RepID=UPI00333B1A18
MLECQLQQAQGDPTGEAERCLAKLGYKPSSSSDWNNQGWSRVLAGKYKDALRDFSKALNIESDNEIARVNRAHVYSKLGMRKEALGDVDYIINLDARSLSGLENKCLLYQEWNEFKQAIDWCGKAVGLYPDNAIALNNRGNAYLQSGEYELAISDFEVAIKSDAQQATAISNLDQALSELGDDDLSRAVYGRLLKATGDDRWNEKNRLPWRLKEMRLSRTMLSGNSRMLSIVRKARRGNEHGTGFVG